MHKLEAIQSVNKQFSAIRESLFDLSMSKEYQRIIRLIETEANGTDFDALYHVLGMMQTVLDRVERNVESNE